MIECGESGVNEHVDGFRGLSLLEEHYITTPLGAKELLTKRTTPFKLKSIFCRTALMYTIYEVAHLITS